MFILIIIQGYELGEVQLSEVKSMIGLILLFIKNIVVIIRHIMYIISQFIYKQ